MNIPVASGPVIDSEALHFLPLGGAGEIGMNLSLYACRGKWLMVDLGIAFAGDTLPGVDILVPEISFIQEHRDDLLALVLTHAHEDHLGAVAYLWPQLRCPVYATPFTATILREKLRDAALSKFHHPRQTSFPGSGGSQDPPPQTSKLFFCARVYGLLPAGPWH